jgi:hypothetical protein
MTPLDFLKELERRVQRRSDSAVKNVVKVVADRSEEADILEIVETFVALYDDSILDGYLENLLEKFDGSMKYHLSTETIADPRIRMITVKLRLTPSGTSIGFYVNSSLNKLSVPEVLFHIESAICQCLCLVARTDEDVSRDQVEKRLGFFRVSYKGIFNWKNHVAQLMDQFDDPERIFTAYDVSAQKWTTGWMKVRNNNAYATLVRIGSEKETIILDVPLHYIRSSSSSIPVSGPYVRYRQGDGVVILPPPEAFENSWEADDVGGEVESDDSENAVRIKQGNDAVEVPRSNVLPRSWF